MTAVTLKIIWTGYEYCAFSIVYPSEFRELCRTGRTTAEDLA